MIGAQLITREGCLTQSSDVGEGFPEGFLVWAQNDDKIYS